MVEIMIKLKDYNLVPAETGIYKIFTSVSSEVYVGSSVDMRKRAYSHYHSLVKGNHHSKGLQAVSLVGDLFFEVLECCDNTNLYEKEDYWVSHYNSIENGYNTYQPSSNQRLKKHADNTGHALAVIKVELLSYLLLGFIKDELEEEQLYETLCKVVGKDNPEEFKHRLLPDSTLTELKPCWRYYCSLYMSAEVANYFSCNAVTNFDDFIEGKTVSALIRHAKALKKYSKSNDLSIHSVIDRLEEVVSGVKDIIGTTQTRGR